jgi:hypothetical protein
LDQADNSFEGGFMGLFSLVSFFPTPEHLLKALAQLPSSSDQTPLMPLPASTPPPPQGAVQTISEMELKNKLLGQIEKAPKLTCRSAACGLPTFVLRGKFKTKFLGSLATTTGRQNLRLASYCPNPVNLIQQFGKLVKEGVDVDGSGRKEYLDDFSDAKKFRHMIKTVCDFDKLVNGKPKTQSDKIQKSTPTKI